MKLKRSKTMMGGVVSKNTKMLEKIASKSKRLVKQNSKSVIMQDLDIQISMKKEDEMMGPLTRQVATIKNKNHKYTLYVLMALTIFSITIISNPLYVWNNASMRSR